MKEDEISKYIKTKISPMNLEDSVQTQIVENCITEAKSTSRNTDQSKESCNPAFLRISHSLFKQVRIYTIFNRLNIYQQHFNSVFLIIYFFVSGLRRES